jgi:hypothetical protein
MPYVEAPIARMTWWTDPHVMQMPTFEGAGRCATVFFTSVLLAGLVVMLVLYGLKRRRGTALVHLQMLLGLALVLAALMPLLEFFGPAWHPTDGQDIVDVLLHRAISWQVTAYYVGSCSGLGLLCYLAVSKRPSMRRALIWLIVPLAIGMAFTIYEARSISNPPDADSSLLRTTNAVVISGP